MFGKKRIYLDYAAGVSANPSSPHKEGRVAKKMLEDARTVIASLVEVQTDDVIFTSGATEANALAILGVARHRLQTAGHKSPRLLYLPSAHASIVENMKLLAEEGMQIEELPIKDFRVDIDALSKMIRDETVLVSMDAVCGETGVVWNTREVASVLRKARATRDDVKIFLHVDASQASLTEKVSRAHFDADILTLDGAKVGNVRGIGAFIAHRTIPLAPLYRGGGQERGLRSGSESPELAKRFAVALSAAVSGREKFRSSALVMRADLIKNITANIPNVFVQTGRHQAPHILSLSLPGRDTDYLVALLDEAGFAVSTRSACETDSEDGSRAVFALTNDPIRSRSTLRVSWEHSTTASDLRRFSRALKSSVAFIDSNAGR